MSPEARMSDGMLLEMSFFFPVTCVFVSLTQTEVISRALRLFVQTLGAVANSGSTRHVCRCGVAAVACRLLTCPSPKHSSAIARKARGNHASAHESVVKH